MGILNTILNIIFPTKCISCGKAGVDLCLDCLGNCRAPERESEEWIFPMYDYRDKNIKKAIWLLKYKGRKGVADILGEAMYGRILEELSDLSRMENFRDALLIPIPLSQKRMQERGYNQSKLIAEKICALDATGKNFILEDRVLRRPKDSEHQARIENRNERLKNIVGCFSVENIELIKNKNIILLDDVVTTGATLSEAKKVLERTGVQKIIAFTVAH